MNACISGDSDAIGTVKNCAFEKNSSQKPGKHHTVVMVAQRSVVRPMPVVIENDESSTTRPASGVPMRRSLANAFRYCEKYNAATIADANSNEVAREPICQDRSPSARSHTRPNAKNAAAATNSGPQVCQTKANDDRRINVSSYASVAW